MSRSIVLAPTVEWLGPEPKQAPGVPSRRELLGAFEEFLVSDVANGAPTEDTIVGYFAVVTGWLRWCVAENILPGAITTKDVKRYRAHLVDSGIQPATRRHDLSVIRRFYDAAVEAGLLQVNPAKSVRGGSDPTSSVDKMKALTDKGLLALFAEVDPDTLQGKRDLCLLGLMAIHGIRRVEAHRLSHGALQFEGQAKAIGDSLDWTADCPVLIIHGKRNKTRRIYLRDDTYFAFMDYAQAKQRAGLAVDAAAPLFVSLSNNQCGHRLNRRSINLIADKHLESASLKRAGVSCHALRHTHGTLAVAGGAKLEHLKDAMGHDNIATTGNYVHAVARRNSNPALAIEPRLYRQKG